MGEREGAVLEERKGCLRKGMKIGDYSTPILLQGVALKEKKGRARKGMEIGEDRRTGGSSLGGEERTGRATKKM